MKLRIFWKLNNFVQILKIELKTWYISVKGTFQNINEIYLVVKNGYGCHFIPNKFGEATKKKI